MQVVEDCLQRVARCVPFSLSSFSKSVLDHVTIPNDYVRIDTAYASIALNVFLEFNLNRSIRASLGLYFFSAAPQCVCARARGLLYFVRIRDIYTYLRVPCFVVFRR